jgi:hypothetical protein
VLATLRQCRCPREGGARSLTDANRGERHAVEIQRVEEGPLGGLHAPKAAATERVACCCMPHVAYAVRRMLHVARAVPTWLGSAVVCCMMLPHAPPSCRKRVVCGIQHCTYLPHPFRRRPTSTVALLRRRPAWNAARRFGVQECRTKQVPAASYIYIIDAYVRIHTYIHTHRHTDTHTQRDMCVVIRMYMHACMYTHACAGACRPQHAHRCNAMRK